jgi:hypothetical protein
MESADLIQDDPIMDPGLDSLAAIAYAHDISKEKHVVYAALASENSINMDASFHALGSSMWRMQWD